MLITAFEPFGDWDSNTSADVGRTVAGALGADLLVLPVDLESAPGLLRDACSGHEAVLCLGLHGRSRALRVERVGLNLADFEIPDNTGRTVTACRLDPEGPDALMSVVDVGAVVQAMRSAGVPADVSNSAGTYLCNAVYFTALQTGPRSLFIHVPPFPGHARAAAARRAMRAPSGRRDWFGEGLSGEQGGVDPTAGLAADLQVTGVLAAARILAP
jgi:pyroglutamyl-peptidase